MKIKFLHRKSPVLEFFANFKWIDPRVAVRGDVSRAVEHHYVVLHGIVNGLEGTDAVLEVNVKVRVLVLWHHGWAKKLQILTDHLLNYNDITKYPVQDNKGNITCLSSNAEL